MKKPTCLFFVALIFFCRGLAWSATLEELRTVTQWYEARIDADSEAGRFLADGAGWRLDEKPRKNWTSRIPNAMAYCEQGQVTQAHTQLQNAVNAWRDHVGLMIGYAQDSPQQMSDEHVIDYLDGHVTVEELHSIAHDALRSLILQRMQVEPPQAVLSANAWSIGAEQYRRLAVGVCSQP